MKLHRCAGTDSLLRALVVASSLAAIGGCGITPTRETPAANKVTQESTSGTYLDTLNRLANGNATQQADAFYEAEHDYTSAPTTANSLRYALALVAPGHPASDAVRGKKLLEQLLATPERLTSPERNLAAFLVKDADIRLQLEDENRRLAATVDERARGQANFDRRTQLLAEENAKLRKQLEDAQRKLDAIKSIERSIIERSSQPVPTPGSRDVPTREPSQTQSTPAGR